MNITRDKRGMNFTGLTELVVIMLIFIGLFTWLFTQTNDMYSTSYSNPLTSNGTEQALNDFAATANDRIQSNTANDNILTQVTGTIGFVIQGAIGLVRLLWNIIVDFFNPKSSILVNAGSHLYLGHAGDIAIGLIILGLVVQLIIMFLTMRETRKQ